MSRSWCMVIVGWAGCETEDAAGTLDGEPVAGRTSYRWVDANGVQVTSGTALTFFDDDGNAWGVHNETGAVDGRTLIEVLYPEADCAGAGVIDVYYSYAAPRFALSTDYVEADGEDAYPDFVVRPDTLVSSNEEFCGESNQSNGSCNTWSRCTQAWVPFDSLVPVQLPSVQFAGPLHPEPAG